MKTKTLIAALLSIALSYSSFALDTSALLDAAKSETGIEENGLAAAATNFLSNYKDDSETSGIVNSLISGLEDGNTKSALTALSGLSSLEFSKEQLSAYAPLLAQVIPALLAQNFDLENGEYGKYIGQAMEFIQGENFVKGADALAQASELLGPDSDKGEILNSLVASYAPILENIDVGQAVEMGKSLLGGGDE